MSPRPYALRGVLIVLAIVGMGVALSLRTDARAVELDKGRFRVRSILGGQSHRAVAESFDGGSVSAALGGVNIDLRGADLDADSVVLDVSVVMGGAKLRVPSDWVVVSEVTPILGGVQNWTRQPDAEGAPELIIRGSVFMGGLGITN